MMEFVSKLSGDIPYQSIDNVMVDIKLAINNLESVLDKNITIDEDVLNTLIHPEIGAVMHCEEHMN